MNPDPNPALFDDPAASFWLKNALKTALQRDPVDALNDAQILVELLQAHLADTFADFPP